MYIILQRPVCRSYSHFSFWMWYVYNTFFMYFLWPHGREEWLRRFYLYNHANQFVFYGFWPLVKKRFVLSMIFHDICDMYITLVFSLSTQKKSACLWQRYVHNHADQGGSRFFPRRRMTLQWFFSPTPGMCVFYECLIG